MRFSLRSKVSIVFSLIAIVAIVGGFIFIGTGASTHTAKARGLTYSDLSTMQKRILSGFATSELNPQSQVSTHASLRNYFPTADDGCTRNLGSNIKVNQNCLNLTDVDLQGRAQANNETAIAQDPNQPKHIVATSNDYRRGDANCFNSYSLDNGRSWNDAVIPMGFTRGKAFGNFARQYWQAGGDPSVAWDTKGNAYFSCQVFERGRPPTPNPDLSSAVYVFRSTHNNGASWNFPGRPVVESADLAGSGIPDFEDKPYITVDNHKGSPFQDRIYVTWTVFRSTGVAVILESHSDDYGETFSNPVLVSTNSPLCTVTFGFPTTETNCNENQFSQPFTAPDGTLYVVYNNFNNPVKAAGDNRNQILISKSTDGGKTFSPPVKVADYYDLPDCATYQGGQDFGRACVPEKGSSTHSVFRATNYPSGQVNPKDDQQVVVTFGSYINMHSNETRAKPCIPTGVNPATGNNLYTGVKTPDACNNDILVSVSNDSGATFTGTTKDPRDLASVTMGKRQATTDQFWQWSAYSNSGRLAVSYYDRQYGNDEFNGFSDVSLSGVDDPFKEFHFVRVTTSSMPYPTQFPNAQGNGTFYGDYTGLSAADGVAHPLWMDTRSPDLALCPNTGKPGVPPELCKFTQAGITANDQDIYSQGVPIPH